MSKIEVSSAGIEELRRRLRFEHVKELAKKSGVTHKAIYNIINGKSVPTIATMERLLKWMQ